MKRNERVSVVFVGRVQGVGFRFEVERIASKLGIKGFVRNLSDGTVEFTGESSRKDLKKFIEQINESMSVYITDYNASWDESIDEFSDFEIRF